MVASGIAVVLVLVVFALGFWLWWPPSESPDRYSDLGVTLIGGATVAVAAFYLEWQFSREAERRDLRLQLGLQKDLSNADLRNRDMSSFSLVGKILKGADMRGTNLKGADLSGADLTNAKLNDADLRGAKLDETPLYPGPTLYPSDSLFPGPIYSNVAIQNTRFNGAKYDAATRWPDHINPEKIGAVRVENLWQKLLGWVSRSQ